MAYQGMDVDGVERSADDLNRLAVQLTALTAQLAVTVNRARAVWVGQDAGSFASTRWPTHRARLDAAHTSLLEMVTVLRRNVTDQRMASSAHSHGTLCLAKLTLDRCTGMPLPERENVINLTDEAMAKAGAPDGTKVDPEKVADWWDNLTEEQRDALKLVRPDLIGSTDGIPVDVRNEVNRQLLDEDIERLEAIPEESLTGAERRQLENARETQKSLDMISAQRDPHTGKILQPSLLLYQPGAYRGDGAVAIAVGNVASADHVATFVPGFDSEMKAASDNVRGTLDLYNATREAGGPGESVAAVYWLGYDTPSGLIDPFDGLQVTNSIKANAGGSQLAQFISGLQTTRTGDPAHMSVVAHSYGSTTASFAAAEYGMRVDELVLIGSPGAATASHARDLGGATVYAGSNSRDAVSWVNEAVDQASWLSPTGLSGKIFAEMTPGPLGPDPVTDDFGAIRFRAEADDRAWVPNFGDHVKYLAPGSESLENIGKVASGQGEGVSRADYRFNVAWDEVDPESFRWVGDGPAPAPTPSPGPSPTPPPQ